MSVKICIVGCGALGSVIGAHLARLKDVEVHAYDVSQEHVRAIPSWAPPTALLLLLDSRPIHFHTK
jgi:saccharopine dehydrogenase-like NADP-dependent oxidoreductase